MKYIVIILLLASCTNPISESDVEKIVHENIPDTTAVEIEESDFEKLEYGEIEPWTLRVVNDDHMILEYRWTVETYEEYDTADRELTMMRNYLIGYIYQYNFENDTDYRVEWRYT